MHQENPLLFEYSKKGIYCTYIWVHIIFIRCYGICWSTWSWLFDMVNDSELTSVTTSNVVTSRKTIQYLNPHLWRYCYETKFLVFNFFKQVFAVQKEFHWCLLLLTMHFAHCSNFLKWSIVFQARSMFQI